MTRRLLLILLIALAAFMPAGVFATGVSPAIIDVSAARGEVVESEFTVINDDDRSRTYFLSTLKFIAKENSSSPAFVPYAVDHSGLPEWIAFETAAVQVGAGERKTVPFKIAVPTDVAAGSYHAAILVSDAPPRISPSTSGGISTSVATLVFLDVEGETVQKLAIMDFLGDGEVFRLRVQNQGNTYVIPEIRVVARNVFGWELSSVVLNSSGHRVLPGQVQSYEGSLPLTSLAFGPISVTAEVSANGGEVAYREYRYAVWPKGLMMAGVALSTLAIVLMLLRLRTSHRSA